MHYYTINHIVKSNVAFNRPDKSPGGYPSSFRPSGSDQVKIFILKQKRPNRGDFLALDRYFQG